MLPQLRCGGTFQIWTWLEYSNRHFSEIENFTYGEIYEWGFSNPDPRPGTHRAPPNVLVTMGLDLFTENWPSSIKPRFNYRIKKTFPKKTIITHYTGYNPAYTGCNNSVVIHSNVSVLRSIKAVLILYSHRIFGITDLGIIRFVFAKQDSGLGFVSCLIEYEYEHWEHCMLLPMRAREQ